ncbi:MAG: GNAT family N-acetyltransferase [Bacteroidota bacterium]
MANIETSRLRLLALNASQLKLYAQSPVLLAVELGLALVDLAVEPEFWAEMPDAIRKVCLPGVQAHPGRYEWYTHWVMILPSDNRLVGGIGLSGWPDEQGRVFMGYYVDDHFAGRGLATEAVEAMTEWAMHQEEVKSVMADTLKEGIASQRVLEKNGFELLEETDEGHLRWQKRNE